MYLLPKYEDKVRNHYIKYLLQKCIMQKMLIFQDILPSNKLSVGKLKPELDLGIDRIC